MIKIWVVVSIHGIRCLGFLECSRVFLLVVALLWSVLECSRVFSGVVLECSIGDGLNDLCVFSILV